MEPRPGRPSSDSSVIEWHKAQLAPALSPLVMSMTPSPSLSLAGRPMTALALISLAVAFGSLSRAEVRPLGSSRSCAVSACRVSRSSASTSRCKPSSRSRSGVTFLSAMPAGRRTASVQKRSLPKVSNS